MASDRVRRDPERMIVLLDTSAIFMVFEHSIRLEDELSRLLGSYDIKIIQEIDEEIRYLLKHGSEKQKQLAKVSLKLIDRYDRIPGFSSDTVDESLLETAKNLDAIVVTNDVDLRKKLLEQKIQTICLRGKNQLMFC